MYTAEDAREVIAAAKYHPLGRRVLAAGTRAAAHDAHGTLADYVQAANEATGNPKAPIVAQAIDSSFRKM